MPEKNQRMDRSRDIDTLQRLAQPVGIGDESAILDTDLAYLSDFKTLEKRRRGPSGYLPWLAILMVVALVIWAANSEIEEVTRCQGRVISSQSIQIIQSLEGGIVDTIHVKEGEMVEKGQPLLQIQDAIYSSRYQEYLKRAETLKAKMARLAAVKAGFAPLELPDHTPPDIAKVETEYFEKAKHHFQTTKLSLKNQLDLAREQETLLLQSGEAAPKLELIGIRRSIADLEGQSNTLTTSTALKAMEDYDKSNTELDLLVETIKADKDRLDRTLITSPVRGTVNKIYINTTGRVIGSGDEIMEIVPADDTLLIEANVRPSDIAFIAPGQVAKVKLTAYDYTVYGGLEGKIEQIGVDTITNEQGESFYQIKIRTLKNTLGLGPDGKNLVIIPGMVTEVDMLTGHKSVLNYLLRPINRTRERALRER